MSYTGTKPMGEELRYEMITIRSRTSVTQNNVSLYTGRRKKQGSPQGEHGNRKWAATKMGTLCRTPLTTRQAVHTTLSAEIPRGVGVTHKSSSRDVAMNRDFTGSLIVKVRNLNVEISRVA